MDETVKLVVGGKAVTNVISYSVEANLYTADDAFSLELSDPEVGIPGGQKCELYINGALELVGIIDRVTKSYDKGGTRLRVEGRDLMGLLVDSYAKDFITIEGMKVKTLAEFLVRENKKTGRPAIPFISREQFVYQDNFIGKGKGKKRTADQPIIAFLEVPQKIGQIVPGMTVFEILQNYAMSRGLMFWQEYWPDGPRFVFGRPKHKGNAAFFLCCQKDGKGNNVLVAEKREDFSKRYSEVTVIGQRQGYDSDGADASKINYPRGVKVDNSFPFFKPFVKVMNDDGQSPDVHARLLLEKMSHDGFQLHYRVPGHTQAGVNWSINELCLVRDELLEVNDTFLIVGRTFERTKQGSFTQLTLGPKGLVA